MNLSNKTILNITLVIFLTLSNAFNTIFFKKVSFLAPHAVYALTVLQAAASSIGFGIIYAILKYAGYYDDMNPECTSYKKWAKSMVILGGGFALFNLLLRAGSRGSLVSGPLLVILAQMTLPCSLVLSYYWLGKKYHPYQSLSAIAMIGGIVVSLIPDLHIIEESHNTDWAIILLVLSSIPVSINTIYLEEQLKKPVPFDIFWAWAVFNIFQLLFSLLFIFFQPWIQNDVSNIWISAGDGFSCILAGVNSYSNDKCNYAWIWQIFYICNNLLFNILLGYCVKRLSSNLLWMSSLVSVPLAALLFLTPLFSSSARFSIYLVISMIIVIISLVVFQYFEPQQSSDYTEISNDSPSKISSGLVIWEEDVLEYQTKQNSMHSIIN